MAGLIGVYSTIPRVRNQITNFIISPSGGSNPIDAGPVTLPNIRGNLIFKVTSGDNGFTSELSVLGGFGEFQCDPTQNFVFQVGTNVNCTVNTLQKNRIEITTPVGDAGGRRYILQFFPFRASPANITQTSVNFIGNFPVTVNITKPIFASG